MRIYSWNMLFRNKELDRAFAFISESDFDIFCLQEVPNDFLERLKRLPYALAHYTDSVHVTNSTATPISVVILSRFPIVHEGTIGFPDYAHGWRVRMFMRLMKVLDWPDQLIGRHALYADIAVPGTKVPLRMFNLHLILGTPERRMEELETALIECDPERPTIVCGDFNILESPRITLLNWLLGGRISDAWRYARERENVEQKFSERGLKNILRGTLTHPLSHSQLDHILISEEFTATNARIIEDRFGSDHCPISATLA